MSLKFETSLLKPHFWNLIFQASQSLKPHFLNITFKAS
jgi:hypothetical protein